MGDPARSHPDDARSHPDDMGATGNSATSGDTGEPARAELNGLGLRHFLDARATARRMLERMRQAERAAFAVAVAERLLRADERRPARERPAYLTTWRPALEAVWRGLAGDATASRDVATAVARCYLGPGFHSRRHDDPADGDDHAIMASLYAAECWLHGCLDFAAWAGWRGFDAATLRAAGDPAWPHRRPVGMSPFAWELAHPAIQAELDQQLSDLELLALDGDALRLRTPPILEKFMPESGISD